MMEKSKMSFRIVPQRLRRLAGMPTSRMHAKAVLLNHGCMNSLSRLTAEVAAEVFTVSVVVCGEEPLRVTEAGMLHVAGSLADLGVIAQLRLMAPVNPPTGVKVTVDALPAVAPGATVIAVPAIVKLCAPSLIVYIAVATALSAYPLADATAFIVSVEETVIGPLYAAELVVGVLPSVV
jgi:hypothetical protein